MDIPVSAVLKKKGDWVITIHPDATVFETIGRMVEHNVGAICVVQGGELLGIFTERDYLRRIALQGRASKTTEVQEVMTADVIFATPDHTMDECLTMMTEKKCRHLPVLRDGHLAGIISIGDCVKARLETTEAHVDVLQDFIRGGYPG